MCSKCQIDPWWHVTGHRSRLTEDGTDMEKNDSYNELYKQEEERYLDAVEYPFVRHDLQSIPSAYFPPLIDGEALFSP